MNSKNRVAPRTLPCGTPLVICTVCDIQPEILTTWVLFDKMLSATLTGYRKFRSLQLAYQFLVGDRIKGFLKINIHYVSCLLFGSTDHSCTNSNKLEQVKTPSVSPQICCLSYTAQCFFFSSRQHIKNTFYNWLPDQHHIQGDTENHKYNTDLTKPGNRKAPHSIFMNRNFFSSALSPRMQLLCSLQFAIVYAINFEFSHCCVSESASRLIRNPKFRTSLQALRRVVQACVIRCCGTAHCAGIRLTILGLRSRRDTATSVHNSSGSSSML